MVRAINATEDSLFKHNNDNSTLLEVNNIFLVVSAGKKKKRIQVQNMMATYKSGQ